MSDGKILELVQKSVSEPACAEVVEFLEKILENARDGRLDSVFIIGTGPHDIIASGWTKPTNVFAMIGGIAAAQAEFIEREVEK